MIYLLYNPAIRDKGNSIPPGGWIILIIFGAMVVYAIVGVIKMLFSPGLEDFPPEELPDNADMYVYRGAQLQFGRTELIQMLDKRFVYFAELNPFLRDRFLDRLKQFIVTKDFLIPKDITYKDVPVLISATAIQLSFGLDSYTMPWYNEVVVRPDAYFADDPHELRVLAGHVQGKAITLSWNHFLEGISTLDGRNIGLHEMAHALWFQLTVPRKTADISFEENFQKLMAEGEEVYNERKGQETFYSNYAYRNLQEFWAESVELFFEKPNDMKAIHPDIFDVLVKTLKQDPSIKNNPLLVQ